MAHPQSSEIIPFMLHQEKRLSHYQVAKIKVYVTRVYVQAPASNFLPSQIVMPVTADGDYNYDIEPAAAETFPDEVRGGCDTRGGSRGYFCES